ncbi:hypothetical protein O181_084699 [Austropuccinia psidii MF-1]|uniref:Uncharacterized protein n=1 Tax=Austropuccinia psidii MF-1 TaxID=1389203 RepID=A0A9Q3FTX0_9BASI|nr:hypothetical protein [Austropuccinia psidii MF-1]
MLVNSMYSPHPTNNNVLNHVVLPFIPNIPYRPPQNLKHCDSQLRNPYTWEHRPSTHNLELAISALLSVNHIIPQKYSCSLHPALNFVIQSNISHSGDKFDPIIKIAKEISTIFKNIGLEPTLEDYAFCPRSFFLNGLAVSV